jgi:hypothetical protein
MDFDSDEDTRMPEKTSWPNLVGSDVSRATTIVRSFGNYHIVVEEYKVSKRKQEGPKEHNPWRVIIYVDQDGFVAITPRVG